MTHITSQTATQDFQELTAISCFLSSRVHLVNPRLTIFNMMDKESQSTAAVLTVKAASETLLRFPIAMFNTSKRSHIKVLLRSDQEVTLTLTPREVQARRQQRTLVERSPIESHATIGAMEGPTGPWGRCCAQ